MANQLRYNTFDNARIKSNNYYACVIDFKLYGSLVKNKKLAMVSNVGWCIYISKCITS